MGIAIILTTLIVRTVLIPLLRPPDRSRCAGCSARARGQGDPAALQGRPGQGPGDAGALQGARRQPGRLPAALLLLLLLIPMYSVVSEGLTNSDPQSMLTVFGFQLVRPRLPRRRSSTPPATSPTRASTRSPFGVNWGVPRGPHRPARRRSRRHLSLRRHLGAPPARSQSRMALPPPDPDGRRPERPDPAPMALFLPLISLLVRQHPAGRRVPLLDRVDDLLDRAAVPDHRLGRDVPALRLDPGFAVDHTPRFPVALPPAGRAVDPAAERRPRRTVGPNRAASADATIRHRRGRQGRRGRRR